MTQEDRKMAREQDGDQVMGEELRGGRREAAGREGAGLPAVRGREAMKKAEGTPGR